MSLLDVRKLNCGLLILTLLVLFVQFYSSWQDFKWYARVAGFLCDLLFRFAQECLKAV